MAPQSALAPAFNALVNQVVTTPLPVYSWGGSTFFAGLSSPINFVGSLVYDGQKLTPATGGQAVAGFTTTPTSGEAAIVIGHSGRTIINGCLLQEATDVNARVRLPQNQIAHLLGGLIIVSQPTNQSVGPGSNVTFTVSAFSSTGPITYQWRLNGTNLPGATGANLIITNVQLAHDGIYSVVVSDLQGSVTSSNVTLTVLISLGGDLGSATAPSSDRGGVASSCRRTVSRSTPSSRAIRRLDQP